MNRTIFQGNNILEHTDNNNLYLARHNSVALMFAIILLVSNKAVLAGKLYRWIDEQGQQHYSDQRPIGGYDMKLDTVSSRNNASGSNSSIRPNESKLLKRLEVRKADRLRSREEASRAYAKKSRRCEMAKERYQRALHDSVAGNDNDRERAKKAFTVMRKDCR